MRAFVAELRGRGLTKSTHTVHRFVTRLAHGALDAAAGDALTAARARPKAPSPRRVSWLGFATDDESAPADHAFVADACARCPPLGTARSLTHAFRRMLRDHDTPESRGCAAFRRTGRA